uniref:non-specific serine/threonine protein kinase n=1 Tax=Rhipicephalus zambeziensis TaxID=60191 RepID=A0A224Z4B9_9ACAR
MMDAFDAVLFKQGAEAKVYKGIYFGKPAIFKERFEKKYRHPDLDRLLTLERMRAEARALRKARAVGVPVPPVYFIDLTSRIIVTGHIENAETVREKIISLQSEEPSCRAESLQFLMEKIGEVVALMHKNHIVHGDLTTSNLMVQRRDEASPLIYVIDFGLSFTSETVEDKGVDLYVLERAFLSAHPGIEVFFPRLLDSYSRNYPQKAANIRKKFEEVKQRGRKRTMVG